MKPRVLGRHLAALIVAFGLLPLPAPAGEGADTDRPPGELGIEESGGQVVLFPRGNLYAPYIADPQQVGFGLMAAAVGDPQIEDSGELRSILKLGGSFGLFRVHPAGQPDRGWQLDLGAGFYGQFDADSSLDNIGWDGIYALTLTGAFAHGLSLKLGSHHISSHVGDEFAERTGRKRINYTREELVAGLSWEPRDRVRTYAEAGWAYSPREFQEPWRLQTGLEYEVPGVFLGGRLGWYVAANLSSWEERDWEPSLTLQIGLAFPAGEDRRWRAGLELHDGRVPIGEFFGTDERYALVGLWLDV